MAPPTASSIADTGSPPRPSLAGVAEASAPSSLPTVSTGDTSGEGTEPSLAQTDTALSPAPGAVPRSAADAPEPTSGTGSAEFQPHGSVSSSGASVDGACSATDASEASSAVSGAPRFSYVRWEDIEDIVTAGTNRTVRQVQESPQSHFLALVRLVVDLNLDALAPWEHELTELRDAVASLEARLAASEASHRREADLRIKAERLCIQASHEHNPALGNLQRLRPDHADTARQLVATNIALEQSFQAAAVLEQRCRRLDKSLADTHKVIHQAREQFKAGIASFAAQLRQLREYLEQSDRQSSESVGASSAAASAMPTAFTTLLEELGALPLAIPPPPVASGSSEGSVSTPPASSRSLGGGTATSGSSMSLTVDSDTSEDSGPINPSALHKGKGKRPAKSSAKFRYAPLPPKKKQRLGQTSVDLKARKAAKQAVSAAASGSGDPQSAPPQPPGAPILMSSAPVSGIAVSAESGVLSFVSVPSGSEPPSSPIPRAPVSPASSTASTVTIPSTPGAPSGMTPGTEASVPVEIDDDGDSEADGAASDASEALGGWPTPHGPDTSSACGGHSDHSTSLGSACPYSGYINSVHDAWESVYGFRACDCNPGSHPKAATPGEPAFTAPGDREAWCKILNARIPQPIASSRVTVCSVAGFQAFADWDDPTHPCIRTSGSPSGRAPIGSRLLLSSNSSSSFLTGLDQIRLLLVRAPYLGSEYCGMARQGGGSGCSAALAKLLGGGVGRASVQHNVCSVQPLGPALHSRMHDAGSGRSDHRAAADSSAAADSPSDTSSARTPIPATDQADVQAELGDNAPAQAGLNVLVDLASTADIYVSLQHFTYSQFI
ncbi:unnamed protein product [Phytophthora fragariaefolia]|uniref:Unnamed protein product n=1 Tax=Phytophthora fragariaefolia TaxID=1490495 RepID=A0A9W6XFH1_9STRA|nr:unnamed protein product [Phytophthora fragariaefolia]